MQEIISAVKGWVSVTEVVIYITEGAWGDYVETNRLFMMDFLDELDKGLKSGILTSAFSFKKVFGEDWEYLSSRNMGYVALNKNPSCKDFVPFGGWKNPGIKLYDRDLEMCELKADPISACA